MTTEAFSPETSRIVPDGTPIEKVAGGFMFTEGPVWNGRESHLTWTDIIGDTIWRWTPGEGTTSIMSPTDHANGLTLDLERPAGGGGLEQPHRVAVGARWYHRYQLRLWRHRSGDAFRDHQRRPSLPDPQHGALGRALTSGATLPTINVVYIGHNNEAISTASPCFWWGLTLPLSPL